MASVQTVAPIGGSLPAPLTLESSSDESLSARVGCLPSDESHRSMSTATTHLYARPEQRPPPVPCNTPPHVWRKNGVSDHPQECSSPITRSPSCPFFPQQDRWTADDDLESSLIGNRSLALANSNSIDGENGLIHAVYGILPFPNCLSRNSSQDSYQEPCTTNESPPRREDRRSRDERNRHRVRRRHSSGLGRARKVAAAASSPKPAYPGAISWRRSRLSNYAPYPLSTTFERDDRGGNQSSGDDSGVDEDTHRAFGHAATDPSQDESHSNKHTALPRAKGSATVTQIGDSSEDDSDEYDAHHNRRATMSMGIRAKACLWRVLLVVLGGTCFAWRGCLHLAWKVDNAFSASTWSAGVATCVHAIIHKISSSTELCWLALLISIAAETMATMLSKHAAVIGTGDHHPHSAPTLEMKELVDSGESHSLHSSPPLDDGSTTTTIGSLVVASILVILCQCGMTLAMTRIDMGVAYSIWAAVGTATVSLWGIVYYQESADFTKILSLCLIVAGVVGLNLGPHVTSPKSAEIL
jgi:multidrug transporter EmrE-like cation transporter